MKTSIPRFLVLGAAVTAFALTSACSPQNSNAAAEPTAPPVVSAPPAAAGPAAPVALEMPAMTETPATVPPNISPTSPLAQVVRLAQAGVEQDIIMVYVTNSSRTFNLDADKIVYLSDLGVPTDVVTAMMQRDQFLQEQFAASQASQLAQQVQSAQPAPEPAPVETAETVTPPPPVTVNYFNDTLSPYGSWVVVGDYGRCWRPAICAYNPSWSPYCDRGRWVYTDCGWYWNSDYAWGATFHYGRWFRDTSYGWCWYPDTVWAPSWVTWRYSDSYCGWAPLPPRTYCQAGVGLVYQSGNLSVGIGFGLGASCYNFVPTQYFCSSNPRNYCVSPNQGPVVYNKTKIVNNIKIKGNGNNQIIINNGIPVQTVASTARTPIRQVPVHQIDRAFAHGGSDQQANRPSRVPDRIRPATSGVPGSDSQPQVPSQSIGDSGNGNSRQSHFGAPAQNHFSSPVNNQTPQTSQGQGSLAAIRTQPERNHPVTSAPQRAALPANYRSQAQAAPAQTPPANLNYIPQPAPARVQPTVTPHNYARSSEARQSVTPPSWVAAAPPQAPPQSRSFSQPRSEARQSYSAPAVVAAPSSSGRSSAPAASQPQGGGRMGNQGWAMH